LDYPFDVPGFSYLWSVGAAGEPEESELSVLVGRIRLKGRVPVLAVGSNAAPSQLREKFADWGPREGPEAEIPVLRVELDGFDVVYAGHVAKRGYLPATLLQRSGATVKTMCTWLTSCQLNQVNPTEGLGWRYGLVPVPGAHVCGTSGPDAKWANERLQGAVAYVALTGYALLGGHTLALKATPATGSTLPRLYERDALRLLALDMGLPEGHFLASANWGEGAVVRQANDHLRKRREQLRLWPD